jgi:hypothetical protein
VFPAVVEQAECLLSLERAESRLTAARASILTAFSAQGGYEDDGHGSVRTWLAWQARTTRSAAAVSVGWARRLAAHPAVHTELAAGTISVSWARQICEWTDRLQPQHRQDADVILLGAAAAGADLSDLAGLSAGDATFCIESEFSTRDDGFPGMAKAYGITVSKDQTKMLDTGVSDFDIHHTFITSYVWQLPGFSRSIPLVRAVAGDPEQMQIMYGIRGERRLHEYELRHLSGYENSQPVRIGNAAWEQFQLDVFGEPVRRQPHHAMPGVHAACRG